MTVEQYLVINAMWRLALVVAQGHNWIVNATGCGFLSLLLLEVMKYLIFPFPRTENVGKRSILYINMKDCVSRSVCSGMYRTQRETNKKTY